MCESLALHFCSPLQAAAIGSVCGVAGLSLSVLVGLSWSLSVRLLLSVCAVRLSCLVLFCSVLSCPSCPSVLSVRLSVCLCVGCLSVVVRCLLTVVCLGVVPCCWFRSSRHPTSKPGLVTKRPDVEKKKCIFDILCI